MNRLTLRVGHECPCQRQNTVTDKRVSGRARGTQAQPQLVESTAEVQLGRRAQQPTESEVTEGVMTATPQTLCQTF